MLRRYLMSGFTVAVLAFFASVRQPAMRSDADVVRGTSNGRQAESLAQQKVKRNPKVSPFGASKTVYKTDDVCELSLSRMQEKLDESDLPIATPKQKGDTKNPPARTVEAMIALVPDPIHTHIALGFDRTVDTIQQALQDDSAKGKRGWVYTSQWLPWDPVPYQAADDSIDRTNIRTFDIGSECAPGLLLFHDFQDAEPSRFLVVLLVGESPTGGINQRQFQYALNEWHKLEGNPSVTSNAPVLRVLGPTFSSSLFSLNRELNENWCSAKKKSDCIETAQVISGSVSASPDLINGVFPGLKRAGFISLTESANSRRDMVLSYFGNSEHIPLNQIALLSEDQTPFGNFSSNPDTSRAPENQGERPLIFHFPREISQLRNAYEANSILSVSSSSSRSASAPNQALKLSLEDRHDQEDDIPSFSKEQDSISEESILSSMTRTMASHNIRVVVISATDVLDEVFVARFLSRDLPDARIVLADSDQILLRRGDVHDFRGMLTVTTYPLIQDDADWGGRFRRESSGYNLPNRIFPAAAMVGTYNAMRVLEPLATLSGNPSEPVCTGWTDCKSPWIFGYEDPFLGGNHPPLWLSAIGRDGFWPVALLDHISPGISTAPSIQAGNGSGITARKPQGSIPPGMFVHLSQQRLIATCLLLVGVLFGIIFCAFASPITRWPEYCFGIPGTNSERRAWIVFGIILCYSWIARLLILDLPWEEFRHDYVNWFLLGAELILLGFSIWLIRAALYTRRRRFWAGLLLLLTIAAEILFNHILLPGDFARRIFYLYRSGHLLSDASPVMPFIYLFAAFICLISRHIQALLVFSEGWRPRVPCDQGPDGENAHSFVDGKAIEDIFGACSSSWRLIHGKLRGGDKDPHGLPRLLIGTFLLLTIAIFVLGWTGFETFETPAYSISLAVLSVLVALFLLYEILWVVVIWGRLRHGLLIPLERSPLRVCFSRVAGFSWRRLWLSLDLSLISRYKPLARAHESVDHLRQNPACPAGVEKAAADVCRDFKEMQDAIRKPGMNPSTFFQIFRDYQKALEACANTVIAAILYKPSHMNGPLATQCDASAEVVAKVLESTAAEDPLGASAEEFVGLIYIHAIQHVLIDIRSHIFAFICGYLFLILALNVYPVGPHHTIILLLSAIFVVFVAVILLVFVEMHRDSILNRTTNTELGKLGIDFYGKLLPVIGVPLIGLLASLFPEISNFLFSWLQPSLQAIK